MIESASGYIYSFTGALTTFWAATFQTPHFFFVLPKTKHLFFAMHGQHEKHDTHVF